MNLANMDNYEDVYKIISWFCCAPTPVTYLTEYELLYY